MKVKSDWKTVLFRAWSSQLMWLIEDFRDIHKRDWTKGFAWCVQGGKGDTGCNK